MTGLFEFEVKITPGDARSLAGGGCNGRCFFANLNNPSMKACARNKLSRDVVFLPRLPVVEFLFRGLHYELSLQGILRLALKLERLSSLLHDAGQSYHRREVN